MYQFQQLNYVTVNMVNPSGALNIVYSPEARLTGNLMNCSELAILGEIVISGNLEFACESK